METIFSKRLWVLSILLITLTYPMVSVATSQQKARLMWERVVGSYSELDDSNISSMASLITQGKKKEAAQMTTNQKRFIDYTVGRLVVPWSNREKDSNVSYNSAMAMAQGIVRDNKDFREFLTGNYLYVTNTTDTKFRGRTRTGTMPGVLGNQTNQAAPNAARVNEYNWMFIEDNGFSPFEALILRQNQWPEVTNFSDFAGIYTLGTSKHLYNAGTNRRPVEWSFQTFLCKKDLHEVMDTRAGDRWVGRDVDRSDFIKYSTTCIGCHGGVLDPLRGAFAFLDNIKDDLNFLNTPAQKYSGNSNTFPMGYVTTDNSWENRANQGSNGDLGWRGSVIGNGVGSFAKMIADSEEFSRCMVTQVFNQVCLREPTSGEKEQYIKSLALSDFENQQYNLKKVYEAVSILNECTGE